MPLGGGSWLSTGGGTLTGALTIAPPAGTATVLRALSQVAGAYAAFISGGTQDNYWQVTPNGYMVFANLGNTAPADAELFASECALWFDHTNGAAKLMVKAKQADGTVKTASIALA